MTTEVIYAERKPVSHTVDGVMIASNQFVCSMQGTTAARSAMTTAEKSELASGSTFFEVDTGDVYVWNATASTWRKI